MNSTRFSLLLIALLSSCSSSQSEHSASPAEKPAAPGHEADGSGAAAAADGMEAHAPAPTSTVAANTGGLAGKVVETMNSGGYTYVLLETPGGKVWAAGPQTSVAVGDSVSVETPMAMPDFHSSTLDRTFDVIYFASALAKPTAAAAHGAPAVAAGLPDGGSLAVDKAAEGHTIAEVFEHKGDLAGKPVRVRGKVVKFSAGIMGKNWLHLQDGTGAEGTNDLTVTTQASAGVGDTVLIEGTVATEKDFGFGYFYDVIVEEAKVTVE